MSASHDASEKARIAPEQSAALAAGAPSGGQVARRRAILILGMHRSGTSALTRLLSLCGGTLPQRIIGPDLANPTGYWEPPEIVDIHNEMLIAAGSSWDDPAEFSLTWLDSPAAQPFISRLRRSFAESFPGSSLMLLKDPRICQFVPLWTSILESMGIEPLFVIPVRNPLEVAASLTTRTEQDSANELGMRGGMPEAKGLLLWLRSFLGAERHSRGRPRSFVSYEALMSDWHGTVVKVADDLAITWPVSPDHIASQAKDFLSSAMRHHFSSAAELEMRGDIAPWFKEAFRWAQNATAGQMGPPGELDRLHDMLRLADMTYQPILTMSTASLIESDSLGGRTSPACSGTGSSIGKAGFRSCHGDKPQSGTDSGAGGAGFRPCHAERPRGRTGSRAPRTRFCSGRPDAFQRGVDGRADPPDRHVRTADRRT